MDLVWLLSDTISSLLSYFWQVLDAISPFLVLIASVTAAIAAIWAFKLSRRILYYQLLSRYSSPEMGKALGIMEELFRLREIDLDNTVFLKILQEYRVCRKGQNPKHKVIDCFVQKKNGQFIIFSYEYQEINEARRQVSHFFQTVFEMFSKTKALNNTSFKNICEFGSFKLLYYVVEWLEITHATTWKFDPKGELTKLLEQSGRKDIEHLKKRVRDIKDLRKKVRPPETWDKIQEMVVQSKQK